MTVSKTLSNWYNHYKRELPWRDTKSPYKIWLSEIILQQTRVEQGLNYYLRFVETYPDIKKLANAPLEEVMKMWQGLGYYSRARNLHETAKKIAFELKGLFPDTFDALIQLKGIGTYTAAAIASICFDEPVAVTDGNVYRFLARYFGIDVQVNSARGKKIFTDLAYSLLDLDNPGNHNQAVMEFGALQCVPAKPDCTVCPFKTGCKAYNNNMVNMLPVKSKKNKIKNRYFNYLVISYKNNIYLKQRTGNDIWKMLYEFPVIETTKPENESEIMNSSEWKKLFGDNNDLKLLEVSGVFRHMLTHQKIFARFYRIEIKKTTSYLISNYRTFPVKNIRKLAVPRLIERYLEGIIGFNKN